MATHEMPADKSRIDRSFDVIGTRNKQVLVAIAQNVSSGLVNRFYTACMDNSTIEKDGIKYLSSMLNKISPMPLFPSGLAQNLANMFQQGASAFFSLDVEIDASTPSKNIYSMHQGGLSLPDPSYYNDSTVFGAYQVHVQNMFQLAGDSPSQAFNEAFQATAFEKALANITVPGDQLFDPFVSFNKMSWSAVRTMAPNFPFSNLQLYLGLSSFVDVDIDAPAYFKALNTLIKSTGGSTVYSYLRWRVIHFMAPYLNGAFVNEDFNFYGKVLGGKGAMSPRNNTCLDAADATLPELLGRLYAQKVFPRSDKLNAEAIFDSLLSAFEVNSQKLTWMDPTTSQLALDKLSKILRLIGYPDKPSNYTNYKFGNHYAENILIAKAHEWKETMATAGQHSDRRKWSMSASTVNAYYDPTRNEIVFPAAILQPPFFDAKVPASLNYGGIGMVGGHELTHSLDSQGRDYNGEGKLVDWWAPSTSAAFQQRVDCIIEQYSKYSPLPGYYVNGNLTQGENIADAGGLKTSHSAYVLTHGSEVKNPSIVPFLTNEQLFFVGFAQTWCSKLTPAATRQRLLTDPHSPPRFRVIGAATNLPAFATAFQCPVGSPMNPVKRCEIW